MEKNKRTHRWAFPLGVILILLAVIGLVSLGKMAIDGITYQIKNPKEKADYQAFLEKIVTYDPDPFDSVGAVPTNNIPQLLNISIWSIIKDEETSGASPSRPSDDNGNQLLPQELVEKEFIKIFGEKPPTHASVEGSDFDFTYDPVAKVYLVPSTGSFEIFKPRIEKIEKNGSRIDLTVDYIDANLFNKDNIENVKASKTMVITIYANPDGNGYRVGAIHQYMESDKDDNLNDPPNIPPAAILTTAAPTTSPETSAGESSSPAATSVPVTTAPVTTTAATTTTKR